MANYATVDDLRADALFRAGEPQSSTSPFWVQSLIYMNRIMRDLMLGGQIAVGRDLATSAGIYDHLVSQPIIDWWWARARGVLMTAVGRDTDTVTLTQASTSGTLGATVASSLAGYRLMANQLPTIPLIAAHTGGTAAITLDAEWPEVSVAGGTCKLWKDTYTLATDFLRFAAPPYIHNTWAQGISIGCIENRDTEWPLSMIPQGPPTQAYLRGPNTIVLNAWDTRAYRFEYEYLAMPADLVAGAGVTLLPAHYRPILSIGTSMLIADNKGDDRAQTFASEYREMLGRMAQEHRKMISGGSAVFGQYKCRSGTGIRAPQPNGEIFLVS
jgi:hypothetical protein